MLGFVNVSVRSGSKVLLPQLSWSLQPGESLAIVGGSGTGKTLIQSLLLGAKKPSAGTIEVDGVSLHILPSQVLQLYRQRIGTGFQEPRLLEHLSVLENLALPLQLRGDSDVSARDTALALLTRAKATEFADVFPASLSPGTQKFLSLLRALVGKPGIVILDEPMDHLDEAQSRIILELLSEYRSPVHSLLLLTRDRSLALELNARILDLHTSSMQEPVMTAYKAPAPAPGIPPMESSTQPSDEGSSKVRITPVSS